MEDKQKLFTCDYLCHYFSFLQVLVDFVNGNSDLKVIFFQEWAHQQYVLKHQQWASHQWGNFYYYKMQTIR